MHIFTSVRSDREHMDGASERAHRDPATVLCEADVLYLQIIINSCSLLIM